MGSRHTRIEFITELAPKLVIWAITIALVFWLIEGSFWLKLLLANAMAASANGASEVTALRSEVKGLREMVSISDGQVVSLSQHVERFSEKECDWDEVAELKTRIEDVEGWLNKQSRPY